MPSGRSGPNRALALIGSWLGCIVTPLSAQSVASTDPAANYLRDSSQVVSIACQIAGSTRPKEVQTRCQVLSFRETDREFVVRLRETAAAGTLDFPLSEVRLHKDRRGAALTRIPEL